MNVNIIHYGSEMGGCNPPPLDPPLILSFAHDVLINDCMLVVCMRSVVSKRSYPLFQYFFYACLMRDSISTLVGRSPTFAFWRKLPPKREGRATPNDIYLFLNGCVSYHVALSSGPSLYL